jgi:hypothetical protein
MDNRKWELYLTRKDTIISIIGAIVTTIFYVTGFIFYSWESTNISFLSFMVALATLVLLLVYFVVGEINLRVSEKKQRYKDISYIVHYCYPSITDDQYKKYLKLAKKGIKKNKHCLMTMHFSDLRDADKWLQTNEGVKLVGKWTYQLSQANNIKIKG